MAVCKCKLLGFSGLNLSEDTFYKTTELVIIFTSEIFLKTLSYSISAHKRPPTTEVSLMLGKRRKMQYHMHVEMRETQRVTRINWIGFIFQPLDVAVVVSLLQNAIFMYLLACFHCRIQGRWNFVFWGFIRAYLKKQGVHRKVIIS